VAFIWVGSNTAVEIVLLVGVIGRSGPDSVRGLLFDLSEGQFKDKLLQDRRSVRCHKQKSVIG